eukprot:CAMPEP_0201511282 /NCGR_PEP_ID=MMETSP0161_2-20130828/3751_1 /ASSEMBLY_ACC=CAM_ASM_000251 /TAXON_ID=180227 /ORGANISM="Neoparamoeba aestuarina, Strain SoJaBio B1-5/56/2" /LENGTH=379 /DNA_ID=CAMNT_0047906709 /DNA_START=124 /DNA_END=1260 /DNA_ORIENTATION=-
MGLFWSEEVKEDKGSEGLLDKLPQVPKDEDGYVVSFGIDEKENILKFFEEYGFVVVREVIDNEQIAKTLDELWSNTEELSIDSIKRDDPATWGSNWPAGQVGILGNQVASGEQAWNNRQNENILRLFQYLYGKEAGEGEGELLSSVDRYGIMRPTVNVPLGKDTDEKEDKPRWRGPPSWLHWDLNPWIWSGTAPPVSFEQKKFDVLRDGNFISEMNGSPPDLCPIKLQGILVLGDSKEDDGGFLCVAGFQKILKEWAKQNRKASSMSFIQINKTDEMIEKATPITARRGSFIVWSSELPHCNYPNKSENFRFAQYIKMFPSKMVEDKEGRAQAVKMRLPKDYVVSEVGMQTLGMKYYQPPPDASSSSSPSSSSSSSSSS